MLSGPDAVQKVKNLLGAQDDWQFLRLLRSGNHLIQRPILFEGDLVQETEGRHRHNNGVGGQFLFVRQIDLVGADLVGPQQFRRLVEVPREPGDLLDVHLLGAHCKVPDLHILDHASAETSHNASSFAIGLAAANSRLMVSQRNARGEEKREAAVGTTYRWNTAVALPHTAQRFSSTDVILMVFVKGVHGVLQWGQILGAYPTERLSVLCLAPKLRHERFRISWCGARHMSWC